MKKKYFDRDVLLSYSKEKIADIAEEKCSSLTESVGELNKRLFDEIERRKEARMTVSDQTVTINTERIINNQLEQRLKEVFTILEEEEQEGIQSTRITEWLSDNTKYKQESK